MSRILFVSPNLPYPPTSGGAQRSALMLEALQAIGTVDCVFLPSGSVENLEEKAYQKYTERLIVESTDKIRDAHLKQLQMSSLFRCLGPDVCAFVQAGRYRWEPSPALMQQVGDIRKYDLVVARYLSSACLLNLFRHHRLIIDVDDYDPDRLKMRLQTSGLFKRLTLRRVYKYSLLAHQKRLQRTPYTFISNPNDRKHLGLKNAIELSNIPYLEQDPPLIKNTFNPRSQTFLMVGTFSYSANYQGARRFIETAWPVITEKFPQAKLELIGRGLPHRIKTLWSKINGVTVLGFVSNLNSAYVNCLASIAPIQAGGGTNIKVLEAAAFGRTSILTKIAHRGFEKTLPEKTACLVAADIDGMAARCIELLESPETAEKMGKNAHKQISLHHTRENFINTVQLTCRQVLKSDKGSN